MNYIRQIKKNKSPILFVISGILLATILTGFYFYTLDKTKGWNPYGWWFLATFAAAMVGGLAGLLIFGLTSRKTNNEPEDNNAIEADRE